MSMNRRHFIRNTSAAGFGFALSGLSRTAHAAEDYRALVCLFFLGGLDNHDTVIPYDDRSYNRWASIRSSMLPLYPRARVRNALLPLETSGFEGRRFALPPEMPGVQNLYASGKAAIVGNVGPLLEPLNRTTFEANAAQLPARLFSHNDQQATWMSFQPEGSAQLGWGGRFADATIGSNEGAQFSAVSVGGRGLFLTGESTKPYSISTVGAAQMGILDRLQGQPGAVREAVRQRLLAESDQMNLIHIDKTQAMRDAVLSNERYNQAASNAQPFQTQFGEGPTSRRLRAVARTIALRRDLRVRRQVFVVGMGGFDTHSNQPQALPLFQAEFDSAITSFQQAMEELNLSQEVTLFTASDFGRTLSVNGDGTDHGWGGHSFVVGGAVRGGAVYGQLPVSDFGHEHDAGGGRLIPTTSVETFAATMGRWFGLDNSQLQTALPRWGGQFAGFMG